MHLRVQKGNTASVIAGVFFLLIAVTFVNTLPQRETTVGDQGHSLSNVEIQDCSDEKQYPLLNYTSNKFYNNSRNILDSSPDVTLTCFMTYPIEWVFEYQNINEGNYIIRERREWIHQNGSRKQHAAHQQRYVIDLIFTSPINRSLRNVTCRSALQEEHCKQTTVTFTRLGNLNNKILINVTNPAKGRRLQQYYDPAEGNNENCSISLVYNSNQRMFECHSNNNADKLQLDFDKSDVNKCYDYFSCGILYNRNKTKFCSNGNVISEHPSMKRSESPFGLKGRTGIVTCRIQSDLENPLERSGTPSGDSSATSHFFFPLRDECQGTGRRAEGYTIYVDKDPLELSAQEHLDFISFCGFPNDRLYAGEINNMTCNTSFYLFAEGLEIKITMKNGSIFNVSDIRLLHGDNLPKIKEDGYRSYTVEINFNSTEISAISCSAPLRKSKDWRNKTIPVTVLPPIPLKLQGNYHEPVKVIRGTSITLRCVAIAEPRPIYEWSFELGTQKIYFPSEWIHNESNGDSSSSILTIPSQNVSKLQSQVVSCSASNQIQKDRKTFALRFVDEDAHNELPLWVAICIPIAIIIVGGIIGFLVRKIIRQKRKLRLLSQAEIEEFMNGKPEILHNTRSSVEYDVNSYAMCLPYNKNYEVLKEQLEIDVNAVIGSGAYGMVLKGILTNKKRERVPVAIKTLKPMDDISYFKALMSELKIMGFIGKHDNIVNLLGAYTKNLQNREIFIAIEFCDNGCMLNFLRSHRGAFTNHVVNGTLQEHMTRASFSTQVSVFSTLTLLRWSMQIANGMDFLYHKKVIHGDLAARNILLSANLTAKIGDFGLSRQLFEYANYIKKQQSPLPWKWLAIECLQDMKFSSQSDVWAYGITLWEIFSLGHSPYPGCSYNEEFVDNLVGGKRPSRPQFATKEIYNVMTKCWGIYPTERPSFSEITTFFDNTIRSVTPEEYMDLESTADTNLLLPIKMEGPRISVTPVYDDEEALVNVDVKRSPSPRSSKFRVSFMKGFKF